MVDLPTTEIIEPKKHTGGFFMSQPIVPLTVPKSRRSEKKSRNEILMKIRLEKVELTFFHSINQEVLETILDKVLFYDHPTQ